MSTFKFKRKIVSSKKLLSHFISHFEFKFTGRWMLFSFIIGAVSGLGGFLFVHLQELIELLTLVNLASFFPPVPGGEGGELAHEISIQTFNWWFLLIPTIGGLISGLLVYTWAPEAEGHGTDGVIKAFHKERGYIRPQVPIIKTLASAITIGTGGSAGREGPIAQIGAGFGSILATKLKLSHTDRRTMVVSGMAAGIGSIFRSPIGGAMFAVECLYRDDMETEGLMPAITSSIIGYSVFAMLFGWNTIFTTPEFIFQNPLELLFYGLFALLCALLGIFFVKVFYGIHQKVFTPLPIPKWAKPAVGGFLLGVVALFFPHILGSGYGWVQQAIDGKMAIEIMLMAALLKMVATGFSIGSGGSGGIFAPSLFVGAMLGGAFGGLSHALFPDIITQPTAFVLIGMAAFFAGAANVPVSMTIMITEMTGGYSLLVPLIFASTLAFFVARKWSIYDQQVKNHVESPAHRSDLIVDILKEVQVSNAYRTTKIPKVKNNLPVERILPIFSDNEEDFFPVANSENEITGLIMMSNVRAVIGEDGLESVILAEDIKTPFVSLSPEGNLHEALEKFLTTGYSSLPVVESKNANKLIGVLSYRDLIKAYDDALIKWTKEK